MQTLKSNLLIGGLKTDVCLYLHSSNILIVWVALYTCIILERDHAAISRKSDVWYKDDSSRLVNIFTPLYYSQYQVSLEVTH